MPEGAVIVDPSRPETTRHEYLSTSPTIPAPLTLASAPQASLVVTTLADVVDATDGVLSLREAITLANDTPGLDRITFADNLRGGTINLDGSLGRLTVTDDLIIDGDPLDGGPDSLRLDSGGDTRIDFGLLRSEGAALRLEDLTIQNVFDMGVTGADAALDLTRAAIDGVSGGAGESVYLAGGSLAMQSSSITSGGGWYSFGIMFGDGASVSIVDSSIVVSRADESGGIAGRGSLELIDSLVVGERSLSSFGISVSGNVLIDGSTITAAGGIQATGVRVNGELVLINSTVADVIGSSPLLMPLAIDIAPDSTAVIVNSTITGTTSVPSTVPTDPFVPAYGLFIGENSTVRLANSIIDDSVAGPGTLVSNGANTFRESTVAGAIAGDRLGVPAEQLFAVTKSIGGTTERSGLLADNGGPTPTVSLLDDPANPALDAADPASAPPVDQRGFLRDAAPDIGAFELGAEPIGDEGLIVTTLADEVVVDGEVSLREAVLTANALPGPNIITFADSLFGGTIELTGGSLRITDDLRIDGDPLNGGPAGIVIDGVFEATAPEGLGATVAFDVQGAAVSLEDMTIRGAGSALVNGNNADVGISRSLLHENNPFFAGSSGVRMQGGSLIVADSTIKDIRGSIEFSALIDLRDTAALVERSVLSGGIADSTFGIAGSGDMTIVDSSIVDVNGFTFGRGIFWDGNLTLLNSLVAGNGVPDRDDSDFTSGIVVLGSLLAVNSTIAGNFGNGVDFRQNSDGLIVNSTITGNTDNGLLLRDGTEVALRNGIVLGNGYDIGTQGGGVFSAAASLWASAPFQPPIEDLTADQVFAETVLVNGTAAGVLADNGGPTLTVALLDDPANPAVDAADPRFAPAVDQRGFVRDAAPDIGAFELGAGPLAPPPPLPPLAEKVPLADADILPVPPGQLVLGAAADAAIGFVDEVAALQNSLGVYLIGPAGELSGPRWVFERIEHAEPSDDASEQARPGGGPLAPGDAVLLSDLFDPAELLPGTAFGLFLAADAWSLNPAAVFEGGTLEFRADGGPASLFDPVPALFHVSESGVERLVAGDIMHTLDPSFFEPLANPLNPGGGAQVTSGTLDGLFTVAFEDKPLAESDRDFNDAIFAIDLLDAGDDLFAVAAAATAGAGAMPAGGADLETLLAAAEAG